MSLFRTIKTNAKHSLSGFWGRAIGIMLLTGLPAVLINALEYGIRSVSGVQEFIDYSGTASLAFDDLSNVALVSTIISVMVMLLLFVVVTPLTQGALRWYYRRTGGENEGVTELFHYFETAKDYFKSLWLHFQIGFRIFFWTMLLSVPLIAGGIFLLMSDFSGFQNQDFIYAVAYALAAIWVILMSIILTIIGYRYFLAPYIMAEQPELKARKAIKQSVKLVRGHKGSLFLFDLSFILWYLPLIFSCLLIIPMAFSGMFYMMQMMGFVMLLMLIQLSFCFYVGPYVQAAHALYARYLIQLGEQSTEESHLNPTREYLYKAEIDRYMEQQTAEKPAAQEE